MGLGGSLGGVKYRAPNGANNKKRKATERKRKGKDTKEKTKNWGRTRKRYEG